MSFSNFIHGWGAKQQVQVAKTIFEAQGNNKKQSFVEWFSGDALDSIWTQNNDAGTGTFQMNDVIDGGFEIISGSTVDNRSSIDFNDIRHYSETGSKMIALMLRESTNGRSVVGFAGGGDMVNVPLDVSFIDNQHNQSFQRLVTSDGVSTTVASTTFVPDTNRNLYEIENRASSVIGKINGSFESLSTTNLSNLRMQPSFQSQSKVSGACTARILYLEVYNT